MSQYARNNPDEPFGNMPTFVREQYEPYGNMQRQPYGNLKPRDEHDDDAEEAASD